MAYVVVRRGGKREMLRTELTGPTVIGRATECDISISDARLSRLHCRLEEESPGQWSLIDLGSRNGTRFNDEKIERKELGDGDTFEIGDQRITFHAGPLVPKRPKAPSAEDSVSGAEPGESTAPAAGDTGQSDTMRYAVNVRIGKAVKVGTKDSASTVVGTPLAFQRPPAAPQVDVTIEDERRAPPAKKSRIRWHWVALLIGIAALFAFYWYFLQA